MDELLMNENPPVIDFDQYVETRREKFNRKLNKLLEEQDKYGVIHREHGQVFLRLGNELDFNESIEEQAPAAGAAE